LSRPGSSSSSRSGGHGSRVERVVAPAAAAFTVSPAALGEVAARSRDIDDRTSAEYLAARAGEVVRDVGRLLGGAERVPTLTLETRIRFAGEEQRAAFARDLRAAIEGLVSRYHDDRARGEPRFTLVVAAHPEAR
jgi:hypothetical protein